MSAWFPFAPPPPPRPPQLHPLLYPSFLNDLCTYIRRAAVARGLWVRVGSVLEPRFAKNLYINKMWGRTLWETRMYSYIASPRTACMHNSLAMATVVSVIPAWLPVASKLLFFPTKLCTYLGSQTPGPEPSLCQEERRSPPAHG